MHQKEAKRQRTGTGHIAKISLKDAEILVGFEFEHNKRLQELLADPQYFPVMMYPGEEVWTARREGFAEALSGRKLLVLILDSTWFCARKLIEHRHGERQQNGPSIRPGEKRPSARAPG